MMSPTLLLIGGLLATASPIEVTVDGGTVTVDSHQGRAVATLVKAKDATTGGNGTFARWGDWSLHFLQSDPLAGLKIANEKLDTVVTVHFDARLANLPPHSGTPESYQVAFGRLAAQGKRLAGPVEVTRVTFLGLPAVRAEYVSLVGSRSWHVRTFSIYQEGPNVVRPVGDLTVLAKGDDAAKSAAAGEAFIASILSLAYGR